jgi:hypothetical protein
MKQDIAPDPVEVALLGADGVVFTPDGISDLLEQPWGRSVHVDLLALTGLTNVKAYLNINAADVNIKIVNSFISNGFFDLLSLRIAVRPKSLDRNFRTKPVSKERSG